MTAPEDVNVDDLKRRARRRLVGAIVLALAAAVFVPMLLESEPKPLGEDVSVKIPPIDDAKFTNRLSDKGKGEAPKAAPVKPETKAAEPRPEEKADAPKSEPASPKAEQVAEAAKTEPPKEVPKNDSATAEAPKSEAPKAEPAKTDAPKPEAAASDAAKLAAPAANHDVGAGFSVQLAAFSDNYGANALANKLKKLGYPAYTEPLATSRGTLYRVRVGPFPTREAAGASRDKLKGEGYAGIVAPSK